jgi:branched-chain amino acid transport system substrate-binding protein
MKLVANMDFEINTYIPGIRIKTSPTDFIRSNRCR